MSPLHQLSRRKTAPSERQFFEPRNSAPKGYSVVRKKLLLQNNGDAGRRNLPTNLEPPNPAAYCPATLVLFCHQRRQCPATSLPRRRFLETNSEQALHRHL